MDNLYINGIPEHISEVEAAVFRARISLALGDLKENGGMDCLHLRIGAGNPAAEPIAAAPTQAENNELDVVGRAGQYESQQPLWNMSHLVAPESLLEELATTVELVRLEPLIFDNWGLRSIEPFPRSALNFHGAPGTGKTLAAHAVAAELGKPIMVASYAQIESKYHGEGPKNVEALFFAAQRDEAVLFMDEADSLLSRRLTNVTQGSEQAINSMRSQILICLERHKGVVIFATNLVENYDQAFETRVRHIRFPQPDQAAREHIWKRHLVPELPLENDVDVAGLATAGELFSGREIKNAVVDAAIQTARSGRGKVSQSDLLTAVEKIASSLTDLRPQAETLDAGETAQIEERLAGAVANGVC
jgi:ATP-dependent 26S proteasome regulatory subunit